MAVTALQSSLLSPRAAASRTACASRCRLDPARIGSSTAAAAAKDPKRPESCREGEPPTKRRRAGEEDAGAAAVKAAEKDGVNSLLVFLLPPGRSPNEMIPLPDSVVCVLQENGTRRPLRRRGRRDRDRRDDALRAIKDCVGAYLEGRPLCEEAPSQSQERVIGQSAPRSILSKAASKSIPSRAALKSIPPRATPTSIPPRAASKSIPPRAAPASTPSKAASKSIPLRTVPSLPAPPKPSESRESVSKLVKTAIRQSPPRSTPLTAAPSLPAPPKKSMKIVVCRREIERLRAAARWEVEQVVRTVVQRPIHRLQRLFQVIRRQDSEIHDPGFSKFRNDVASTVSV